MVPWFHQATTRFLYNIIPYFLLFHLSGLPSFYLSLSNLWPFFLTCWFCVYVCMLTVTRMQVFKADPLILSDQLACSSLEKTLCPGLFFSFLSFFI